MIPFEDVGAVSLNDLAPMLDGSGDRVLSLTCFLDADPESFESREAAVRREVFERFGPDAPPTTVVAQAPGDRAGVVYEAAVLRAGAADVRVSRAAVDGFGYTLVEGRGARQVHGGSFARGDGGTASRAARAFAKMEAVLARERMGFGHVVRQWGFIEGVLDVRGSGSGCQGYQAFNDERTRAYGRTEFPAGYPAATGIGQAGGGVVLAFVALDPPADVRVVPLSNPRQVDAHCYSEGVLVGEPLEARAGKTPPKFERAKLVARDSGGVVFVSGTAAILGERSVGLGDVAAQTRTTIENIAALLRTARLSRLRAYVKRAEDIPVVRRVCEDAYGGIPALYVKADVCRDELLVELEGELVVGPEEVTAMCEIEGAP